MNKVLKSLLALSLSASVAFAGDDKDLKKVIEDQGIYVETAKKGIVLSGYVDVGYSYNFNAAPVGTKGAYADNNSARGDFSVNAVKIALEKQLSDENTYQAGFRTDLMIGEDAAGLGGTAGGQASEDYLLEQAYVNFRVPIGNGLDFKFGKFVTLLGYEVIEKPANLNISYGNLFQNLIPLYHTGVLGSYKFNDMVSADFGVVNGWNNSNNAGVLNGDETDGYAFTGALTITNPGGNATLKNSFIVSPWGESLTPTPAGTDNAAVFVYDVWGNWAPKFANDKLLLGFNADFQNVQDTGAFTGDNSSNIVGLALYAKYQFTDKFALAGRADYIHSDADTATAAPGDFLPENLYSWTLTASLDVWENLLTRLEYRADYGQNVTGSGDFANTVELQLVYSF
jgi:hypothetical protein